MGEALVVGAGPAGLMAAGVLAEAGAAVTVVEAMPTIGRKFLMAGKSGLNLTKAEPEAAFRAAYRCDAAPFQRALAEFGPQAVQDWARGLEQAVFTGSSGRVFPVAMKASPLLRAWAARLSGAGVRVRTGLRWTGFDGPAFSFADGSRITPRVAVLALGGASWPRLGSDAAWVPWLHAAGVPVTPFRPANMGFDVDWTPHMAAHVGAAVKPVALHFGGQVARGEFVVTRTGVEGGAIYSLSALLRDGLGDQGVRLSLDLAPDRSAARIAETLARVPERASLGTALRRAGLSRVANALLREGGALPREPGQLAARIKATPLTLTRPRPIAEAISVAGGVAWEAVTGTLALRALPHVHVAGEMLDWEAPTGGYLLTACLATGRLAGRAAAGLA